MKWTAASYHVKKLTQNERHKFKNQNYKTHRREQVCDLRLGRAFLDMTPKVQQQQQKIDLIKN